MHKIGHFEYECQQTSDSPSTRSTQPVERVEESRIRHIHFDKQSTITTTLEEHKELRLASMEGRFLRFLESAG
jgi:hypothetical protein